MYIHIWISIHMYTYIHLYIIYMYICIYVCSMYTCTRTHAPVMPMCLCRVCALTFSLCLYFFLPFTSLSLFSPLFHTHRSRERHKNAHMLTFTHGQTHHNHVELRSSCWYSLTLSHSLSHTQINTLIYTQACGGLYVCVDRCMSYRYVFFI